MEKDINRLKVVLAEKKKTNKWLAELLDVELTELVRTKKSQTNHPTF